MKEFLVLSALGRDVTGIVNDVSQVILDAGGNIEDSRMTVLGGEFALMVLVTGDADVIDDLVDAAEALGERLGLTVVCRRTEKRSDRLGGMLPYQVEILAMDHPGIVHDIANFFAARGINIEDLATTTYPAPHTGTPMFSMHLVVAIPGDTAISELRQDFIDFCDSLNLESSIEPETR